MYCLLFKASLPALLILSAQEKSKEEQSYFKLSGSYLTNAVYNGRKDSATLPYITPSLAYYDKSGFNIGVSASYLNSADAHRIDFVFN